MGRVVYAVTVEVAPDRAQEWDAWHSEDHVPALLREPGFLSATKLRDEADAADGWARYVTHYVLESREALERYLSGGAAARLRAEHLDRFGTVSRVSRVILHETERFARE